MDGAGPAPSALFTDLYELSMADSYLRRGMTAPATFSLFVRDLPAGRGFLVAAGVEDCLDDLERFRFGAEELDYVTELFDAGTAGRLRGLRFSGDVWAVPEGSVVLADEPILEATAPIAEAQLVETLLLNHVTYQTAIATKAARCRIAAPGVRLVDFSFRRTQGVEAAMAVARVSAMVGFEATSNVEAARRYGLQASGTMAHSYVEAFPSEEAAFRAFAQDFPDRPTFLVDTYDTLDGVRTAIRVVHDLHVRGPVGVRLDSGDLLDLSRRSRALLDGAGLQDARIVVSGSLDEYALADLLARGASIDVAGVGTRMGVSADAPSLDSAYKLVEYDGRPVMKLSSGKMTLPGAKQVFRGARLADVIALRGDQAPGGTRPLLRHAMQAGARLHSRATLAAARETFRADLAELPAHAVDLRCSDPPRATLSDALRDTLRARRAALT